MITFEEPKTAPVCHGVIREVYLDKQHVGDIVRSSAFNYYYQAKGSALRGPLSATLNFVCLQVTEKLEKTNE